MYNYSNQYSMYNYSEYSMYNYSEWLEYWLE